MDESSRSKIDKKIINSIFKKITKDIIKYLPSKIVPAIISIISLPIYTSIFSSDEYGLYSMIISVVGLISSIIALWLGHSALRYYDEYKEKRSEYYSSIFISLFVFYLALLLIFVIIIISPINILETGLMIIAAVLVLTVSLDKIFKKILRGARYALLYSFLSVLLPVGKLLLVLLLHEFMSPSGILIILLATMIIELLIIAICFIKIKPEISFGNININFIKRMMIFGFPLLVNSIMRWVLSVSDRYLIAFFCSYEETGLYSVGYSIGNNSLKLVFTLLISAAYPVILKAWNNYDQEHVEILISRLIKYFYILCIPIVSALFVISPLLIDILAADEYYLGYMVLPWVGMGILVKGLSEYLNKLWELTENTKVIVYLNFIAAISNIILNLIFIPRYGFAAAGVTTFASYSLYLFLTLFLLRGKFRISLFNKNLLIIILASLLMLIPVSYINSLMKQSIFSFIVITITGASVYFTILYLLGVIKKEVSIALKIMSGKS